MRTTSKDVGVVRTLARSWAGPVRSAVPDRMVPLLVDARTWLALRGQRHTRRSAKSMRVLLDALPEYDLAEMTRRHVWFTQRRAEYRFHPELVGDQEVVGIEHLAGARDLGRGVMLSFMHYGHYEGMFLALRNAGVETDAMTLPVILEETGTYWQNQHGRILKLGTTLHDISGGSDLVRRLLGEGRVVAMASDVTSRTKVHFLGKDRLASFGAPRLAFEQDAPVVVVTSEWAGDRPRVICHPPLMPADYADAGALYADLLALHEASVRTWPWAYELPEERWVEYEAGA